MSLPARTASIMLLNMGQSLITWIPVRGKSLAEDMIHRRACFPFQFILKINHLSKLNVRGCLFCLNSKLVRRLIKASVVNELLKGKSVPFKGHFLPWVIHIGLTLNSGRIQHTPPRVEFILQLEVCEPCISLKTAYMQKELYSPQYNAYSLTH